MKLTQAIKNFLEAKAPADFAELYNEGMELQILVDTDKGELIQKEYKGNTYAAYLCPETRQEFKNVRIPYKANTNEAEYDLDRPCTWAIEQFAKGIGMTGWNWKEKVSKYFMFDFDSIIGHSDNHEARLTNDQLDQVKAEAEKIDWITVRQSTAGHGLHFYVFVDDIPTKNHNEHAALARAILGKMSGLTGFDFSTKLDVCGGNGWVWHQKYERSRGEGFKLLKQGKILGAAEIPPNWQDHIKVVGGSQSQARCTSAKEANSEDRLGDLVASRSTIELDETHRKLFAFFDDQETRWFWDAERKMLVCHTHALQKAHEELGYSGFFDTISSGSSDMNCYAFPLRKGAWVVRRFSPGVAEHGSWHQDGSGWTRCFFNKELDFRTACRSKGGQEIPDKEAYEFREASIALEAAALLGEENLDVAPGFSARKTILRRDKNGRLIVEVMHDSNDNVSAKMAQDWRVDTKKKVLSYVGSKRITGSYDEGEVLGHDDLVRHIVAESGDDAGWVINIQGEWVFEPLPHAKMAMKAQGYKAGEVEIILGGGIFARWKLVNKPFQPEYPGDREWNRDAAKLRYNPDLTKDKISHPTWDKILKHCGQGLDDAVVENEWCRRNGIATGADYLFAWVSCMFKEPSQPLPYLFFCGPQNVGKSSFHESISLLFNKGYERAESSLLSNGNFNGELEGVVLAVVEEIDFSVNKQSLNKLKDWVTSPNIQIHKKNAQPYMIPNFLHFVQVSNDSNACPLQGGGDSRVTMSYVKAFKDTEVIPKKELMVLLQKEATDFVTSLYKYELGPSSDRLRIPIVETAAKRNAEQNKACPLASFITVSLTEQNGSCIKFDDFYTRFSDTLDQTEKNYWSKSKVSRRIPADLTKGRMTKGGGGTIFANVYWKDEIDPLEQMGKYYQLDKNNWLRLTEEG